MSDLLFTQGVIGKVELPNRLVRSATFEGMAAPDGSVTPRLIALMEGLALGGVGLIVTGHAFVSEDGRATPHQLGAQDDRFIPGLADLAAAVRKNGSRAVLQIAHAGAFAKPAGVFVPLAVSPPPVNPPGNSGGVQTGSQSKGDTQPEVPKAMSDEDIREVTGAFGRAALRAKRAGFDGVQIHAAHGYLLSQFLSPLFNRRADHYGGLVENRARALTEVFRRVRDAVGADFPILIKMNCSDFEEGGFTLSDAIRAGEMLRDEGVDAIELSGGLLTSRVLGPSRTGIGSPDQEAYFKKEAHVFRLSLGKKGMVPIILVGGIRSRVVAERLLETGTADFVALSRPLIREPGLPSRWKSGSKTASSCDSDNLCFRPALTGRGVRCLSRMRPMHSYV